MNKWKSPANPKGLDLLGHNLCVLDEKGFEHLDDTPVEMPDHGFEPTSSADEKLIIMINSMQEKINRMAAGKSAVEYETVEDAHDFDVPYEGFKNPYTYDSSTKQKIQEAKRVIIQRKKQKQTGDQDSVDRKSAETDGAKRLELDKDKQTSASASSTKGADE